MAGYIGTGAVPQATQKRDLFTATAGQISFATSGYSPGYVDVYMNGVKLSPTDFTATNGSDVDLAVAAVVDDILEIVSFTSFEVTLGGLQAANNLSDLIDAPTAITNLGVTSTAAELNKLTGATLSTAELNQLNAITRGSIIYGDAGGATARLAAGGVDTVLTSDGTNISWAAAAVGGGGSMEFIASSGALSAAADVAFAQFDSSKYDSYEFNLLNVKPSDNVPLVAEASTNGGSSYDGSTSGNYHDAPATNRANFAVTASSSDVGNGTNEYGATGRFLVNNPASGTYTYTQFLGTSMNQSGELEAGSTNQNCTSLYLNTAEVNAIKFKFTSGNIASGEIVMYGIKNS